MWPKSVWPSTVVGFPLVGRGWQRRGQDWNGEKAQSILWKLTESSWRKTCNREVCAETACESPSTWLKAGQAWELGWRLRTVREVRDKGGRRSFQGPSPSHQNLSVMAFLRQIVPEALGYNWNSTTLWVLNMALRTHVGHRLHFCHPQLWATFIGAGERINLLSQNKI